jgi:hypothetical protein
VTPNVLNRYSPCITILKKPLLTVINAFEKIH